MLSRRVAIVAAGLAIVAVAGLGVFASVAITPSDGAVISQAHAVELAAPVAQAMGLTKADRTTPARMKYWEFKQAIGVPQPRRTPRDDSDVWVVTFEGETIVREGPPDALGKPFKETYDSSTIVLDAQTGEVFELTALEDKTILPWLRWPQGSRRPPVGQGAPGLTGGPNTMFPSRSIVNLAEALAPLESTRTYSTR